MPTKPLTYDQCFQACSAVRTFIDRGYEERGYNGPSKNAVSMASDALGLDKRTMDSRLKAAQERFGLTPSTITAPSAIEIPEDSDRPHPIDDVLARNMEANDKRIAKMQRKPLLFLVKPEPFAVCAVGDPHITNKGTSLTHLVNDLELLRSKGIRSIQMGDLMDNFHKIGKLAENEAQNRMSIKEGLSLAEWLIAESGVKWDAQILGNHDLWLGTEGVALLGEFCKKAQVRMFDWNARLIYQWGDASDQRHVIAASHDFKGHSQYNPTHGPAKMALWDGTADTYIAGHRHHHADAKEPNGWRGKTYQLVRVRGYKDADSYAAGRAQFPGHQGMEGRSALIVINPLSTSHDGRQRVFMDLADGVEYLEMLKRRT